MKFKTTEPRKFHLDTASIQSPFIIGKISTVLFFLSLSLIVGCATAPRYSRSTLEKPKPVHQKIVKSPKPASHTKPHHQSSTSVSSEEQAKSETANEEISSVPDESNVENANYREYQVGVASYYAKKFQGNKTANGERFDNYKYTAAHRKLPFNTTVRVTNLANNRSVVVRINDRGPHKATRVLDVSYSAAKELGMIDSGTARVKIEIQE